MTTKNKTYSEGVVDAVSFMVTLGNYGYEILRVLGGYTSALEEFSRFISDATEFWEMTYKTEEEALVDWEEYCEHVGQLLIERCEANQISGKLPSVAEIRAHCIGLTDPNDAEVK